jgi:hypothetical protein
MPDAGVSGIEIERIGSLDEMHEFRKIAAGSLNQEMEVVVHQTKSVDDASKFLMGFVQVVQKCAAILIILDDRLFLVSPGCDVVKSASEFDSQLSGHQSRLLEIAENRLSLNGTISGPENSQKRRISEL